MSLGCRSGVGWMPDGASRTDRRGPAWATHRRIRRRAGRAGSPEPWSAAAGLAPLFAGIAIAERVPGVTTAPVPEWRMRNESGPVRRPRPVTSSPSATAPGRPPARRRARVVGAAAWASLAVTLLAWALLYAGDAWVPATLLMFGPRWLLAVPPAVLLVLGGFAGRRARAASAGALVVALGPVMGFNLPWDRLGPEPTGGPRLRVLTCNLHYGRDATALEALVADAAPDVVAVQEWDARADAPG